MQAAHSIQPAQPRRHSLGQADTRKTGTILLQQGNCGHLGRNPLRYGALRQQAHTFCQRLQGSRRLQHHLRLTVQDLQHRRHRKLLRHRPGQIPPGKVLRLSQCERIQRGANLLSNCNHSRIHPGRRVATATRPLPRRQRRTSGKILPDRPAGHQGHTPTGILPCMARLPRPRTGARRAHRPVCGQSRTRTQ